MAITIQEINELRKKTQAGLMDCKKALTEANGDMEAAMEILRKKGQLVAAKRSDRDAAEGCVLAKVDGNYGAMIALKCETDFVAKNADFVALATKIIDAVVANKCKSMDEVNNLTIDGENIKDAITLNKKGFEEAGKGVAMQVAAMSPIALDADSVPQDVKDAETRNAVDKAKQNQIGKAVENALKKAGINPAHVDSEDHIESNTAKGWITPEEAAKAREIKATVAKEAEANLKEQMIENIAKGMVAKFYKENCLLEQAYIDDNKVSVAQYLKSIDKDLTVTDFKRFTLRAE